MKTHGALIGTVGSPCCARASKTSDIFPIATTTKTTQPHHHNLLLYEGPFSWRSPPGFKRVNTYFVKFPTRLISNDKVRNEAPIDPYGFSCDVPRLQAKPASFRNEEVESKLDQNCLLPGSASEHQQLLSSERQIVPENMQHKLNEHINMTMNCAFVELNSTSWFSCCIKSW